MSVVIGMMASFCTVQLRSLAISHKHVKREPQRSTVVAVGDVSLCTKFPEYKMLVRGSDGWLRRLWIGIPPKISLRAQLYRKNLGLLQSYSEVLFYLQVRRSLTDITRSTYQYPTVFLQASYCKVLFQMDVRLSWRPDGTISWFYNEEIHESSMIVAFRNSQINQTCKQKSDLQAAYKKSFASTHATEILSIARE